MFSELKIEPGLDQLTMAACSMAPAYTATVSWRPGKPLICQLTSKLSAAKGRISNRTLWPSLPAGAGVVVPLRGLRTLPQGRWHGILLQFPEGFKDQGFGLSREFHA